MLQYFTTREELANVLLRHGPTVKPMFPLCCFRPWRLGQPFIQRTSFGVLQVREPISNCFGRTTRFSPAQYVFVRVALSLVTFVLLLSAPEALGEGQFNNFKAGYVYIVAILNASQLWAMYCLVFFYHELYSEMVRIHPLAKFLSIKVRVA